MLSRRRVLAFLTLGTLATAATGRRLYRFVDDEGIIHYTDRRPASEAASELESWSVRVESQPVVTLRRITRDGRARILGMNRWHGPVQVGIDLSEASNLRSEPPLPADLVIEGFGEAPLLELSPADEARGWSYRLEYIAVPGDPDAVPEPYRYRPPFRASERYYIGQAFDGSATHDGEQSRFSVDLGMPRGTPVLAARPGVVMHAEEDYFGSGLDPDRFAGRANHVRVVHDDGTMALYAHLELESVAVRPGQRVERGELVGLSGNTGLSTGPHLHFSVQRNVGLRLVSMPFVFDDGSAEGAEPVAGRWLEHPDRRR